MEVGVCKGEIDVGDVKRRFGGSKAAASAVRGVTWS